MRPRVFVSSTYYDLRYIRENIEKLLESMGFDSVLFESGDITFEHDKPLDISCYREIANSNMMILIVGGRYGTEASSLKNDDYIHRYEKYYISITKKEFYTAREKGIPVLVFVEDSVLKEYETFKLNKEIVYKSEKSNSTEKIRFTSVDSVNVFEFIGDLYATGLPVYGFSKYEDIEHQFKAQISGLLYLYLENLVKKKNNRVIEESVDNVKNLVERIEAMLQKVGEKVLENDPEVLAMIKKKQTQSIVDFCIKQMAKNILIIEGDDDNGLVWEKLSEYLLKDYLFNEDWLHLIEKGSKAEIFYKKKDFRGNVKRDIDRLLGEYKMKLAEINFHELEELSKEIKDYFQEDKNDEIKSKFAKCLKTRLLPF